MKLIWSDKIKDPKHMQGYRKCMHCESCVAICPQGALRFENNKLVWDKRRCIGCGDCVGTCPENVIKLVK